MVVGGAGYIGSHTCIELIKNGYEVVVVDNLCNASIESLKRVRLICNLKKDIYFHEIDIRDTNNLSQIFKLHTIDAVIHFAAHKSVGDSINNPINYYDNNISGTISLLSAMKVNKCKHIVFSSSANVYGDLAVAPIKESSIIGVNNPYGFTKLIAEEILNDLYKVDSDWQISILRYFNPVGAHESGLIGEDSKYEPSNLIPSITRSLISGSKKIKVFGSNYKTRDGTGIRDYIHVSDLAVGHVKAIQLKDIDYKVLNIGTGRGHSDQLLMV